MKLDPAFKIEKACSADRTRPVLTCAYLDVENRKVVATDSYVLAVLPCEIEEGDTAGLIPSAAFPALRKASKHEGGTLAANGSARVVDPFEQTSQDFPRPDGQYPDWQRLCALPEPSADDGGANATMGPLAEFGINVAELAKLAAALGSDTVRIKVFSPLKPLHVSPVGSGSRPDAFGIAMPFNLR